jgi:hypothetical protein
MILVHEFKQGLLTVKLFTCAQTVEGIDAVDHLHFELCIEYKNYYDDMTGQIKFKKTDQVQDLVAALVERYLTETMRNKRQWVAANELSIH